MIAKILLFLLLLEVLGMRKGYLVLLLALAGLQVGVDLDHLLVQLFLGNHFLF